MYSLVILAFTPFLQSLVILRIDVRLSIRFLEPILTPQSHLIFLPINLNGTTSITGILVLYLSLYLSKYKAQQIHHAVLLICKSNHLNSTQFLKNLKYLLITFYLCGTVIFYFIENTIPTNYTTIVSVILPNTSIRWTESQKTHQY